MKGASAKRKPAPQRCIPPAYRDLLGADASTVTQSAAGTQRLSWNSNPIFIDLRVSRLLGAGLAGAYAGAFAVVILSPLATPVVESAMLILALCALRDAARHLRPGSPHRIRRMLLKDTLECTIVSGAGEVSVGRPLDTRLVHPWIVAFTLEFEDGGKKPVLVLPDMTSRRSFHALRVRLMHSPGATIGKN